MMTAVMSCTANDLYSFNLPFAVYSWAKLGVKSLIIHPFHSYDGDKSAIYRLGYSIGVCQALGARSISFTAPKHKIVTYAQCARLYAAATPGLEADILITTDADMAVFNQEYWDQFDYNAWINIIGIDLVPPNQYPMCYIAAPVVAWHHIMQVGQRNLGQCLDDLLGGIEAEHFKGNYWAKDQETICAQVRNGVFPIKTYNRAREGTQFATRRADRDGWQLSPDIIDAHLPRPGYTDENFKKIKELFEYMYPGDDHSWMEEFRKDYLSLKT